MPDSKGIPWSHGSLFKTLLDTDQYVTALKNSSHWSDIYFGMASTTTWIQNSQVRPQDLLTFHIFTSHSKQAICLVFSQSNSHKLIKLGSVHSLWQLWCFMGVKAKPQTCVHKVLITAKPKCPVCLSALLHIKPAFCLHLKAHLKETQCKHSSRDVDLPAFFLVHMNRFI